MPIKEQKIILNLKNNLEHKLITAKDLLGVNRIGLLPDDTLHFEYDPIQVYGRRPNMIDNTIGMPTKGLDKTWNAIGGGLSALLAFPIVAHGAGVMPTVSPAVVPWIAKNVVLPMLGGELVNNITRKVTDNQYKDFGDWLYRSTPLENWTKGTWAETPTKFVVNGANPGYWAPYGKITNTLFKSIPEIVNHKMYGAAGNLVGRQLFRNPTSKALNAAENLTNMVPSQYRYDFYKGVQAGNESAVQFAEPAQWVTHNAPRNNKGQLLAPNGKPTKLSDRQYAQVRTEAFKQRFGDWTKITQNKDGTWNIPDDVSKAIDPETGEPMVWYHGSVHNFTEFKTSAIGNMSGDKSGFYFTNNKGIAKSYYSKETGKGLDNILVIFGLGKLKGYKPTVYELFLNIKNPKIYESKEANEIFYDRAQKAAEAKEKGYDGVLFKNVVDGPPTRQNVEIVFDPNQIEFAEK